MCIGCGACYYACKNAAVQLVHVEDQGMRPRFDTSKCDACTECLNICPAVNLDADLETRREKISDADHEFGPALEIWEGYAADENIRHRGSSGGLLSALSLYCLENEGMQFVLHSAIDADEPWRNKTVTSRTREEIVSRTGSRYAPSSPCEGLDWIEQSDGPCVFIGKPCDVAGVAMVRRKREELDRKLGVVLTFFCAGTPSTRGTLDLLKKMEVQQEQIENLHYRGEGWPGRFRVRFKDNKPETSMSYQESWHELTGYRPIRCNLCPDGLGRIADISCGDAWNSYHANGDEGRSLVLVRTEKGRRILHGALSAGYVKLEPVDSHQVLIAQKNLLDRRRQLFGRLLGMRLLAIPTPKFKGFSLWRSWRRLTLWWKIKTVLGTSRRMIKKGLWRRQSQRARQ